MTASQHYGRFAIPFRLPLLFSLRMARVIAAENGVLTWTLLTCGIIWSPVDSCLDCMAREVTLPTRIYLANRSQPSPGAGVHFLAKWVAYPLASQVGFCAFLCTIFASSHYNTLLSLLFHIELLCHVDSSVIIRKNIICLTFDCARRNFWGHGEVGLLHSFDCVFNSGSKSLTHVSSISTIRNRNGWPSELNLVSVMLHFPGVSVSVQQSSSEGTISTNFSFLQFFFLNTEYWCWWDLGSLWYFLARRSTILCKKVHHKFHASFICWCFWPSWPWVIVYGDTSFTKTSSPTGNCTTVHCLLTTNCATVHCLLTTNYYCPLSPYHKRCYCPLSPHHKLYYCPLSPHHKLYYCPLSPHLRLYYCPLSPHHKLHAKHCEFLSGFWHVNFQYWCTIFDLQPSQYPRRLQTPCLTLVNSKGRTLGK